MPDQHIILNSLYQALVPGEALVDGRSERDRLAFLADFASLINFYDQTNQINGSWRPFLLKDPVFLLAHISSIRFQQWQSFFQHESKRLQTLSLDTSSTENLAVIINGLSDQLIEVFMHIERWTAYMQQSFDYDLKKYVLREVKNNFSEYFWAFLSFRDAAYRNAPASGLEQVNYSLFESFDELIWKISRGKRPYWQVLQINEELVTTTQTADQNLRNCYQAINRVGEAVFGFLHTIVQHAPQEYDRVKKYKSHYPDTTLLRVFEKLLRIYQVDQNRLAEKHLEFYYRDILKQAPRKAIADKVFVCAIPSGNTSVYSLKGGTLLDAGLDENNNPVIFETTEDISVNPAKILNAFTVSYLPQTENYYAVYTQSIPTPDQVVKDEQGAIRSWSTFGGSPKEDAVQVKAGLILATPILLLQEGDRTINIFFSFEKQVSREFLVNGIFCLSTQSGWLNIGANAIFTQISPESIQLRILLSASQPAIVPFPANAEGISTEWPMLKMEFTLFPDPSDPPVITNTTIEVAVSKYKNVQLFNDYGALNPKTPFQPFGNMAQVNSNFIIGSTEVFSKPLQSLYLEFDWDSSLPKNFQNYYQPYNDYLSTVEENIAAELIAQQVASLPDSTSKKGVLDILGKLASSLFSPLKKLILLGGKGVIALGKLAGYLLKLSDNNKPVNTLPTLPDTPFNNVCFTVKFSMLDQHAWNLLNLGNMTRVISPEGNVRFIPYRKDAGCVPPANSGTLLFCTETITTTNGIENAGQLQLNTGTCSTLNGSYFGLVHAGENMSMPGFPYTPDAAIQKEVLKYSDQNSTGFIRMTLTGPSYGFGTSVYPNVVANIALKNALIVSKKATNPPTPLNNPANPPFVPKVKEFQLHYSASVSYVFNQSVDDYPIQCFSFSSITTGLVYDQSAEETTNSNAEFISLPGSKKISSGLQLYPSFPYNGILFLALDNVVAPDTLNFYFQLAKNYASPAQGNQYQYAYLNNDGWNNLPLLSDGTRQFGCSGIIKVNLPDDISGNQAFMGVKKSWLSIGVIGDVHSISDTVFLMTNGIVSTRCGSSFLTEMTVPSLAASQITRPVKAIPQIAAFLQPFASFGGKAAENNNLMNRRVSNRLKTKDRAVTTDDFYRLIKLNYPEIFYVKTLYNIQDSSTKVYVAGAIENGNVANAFMPLVNECLEADIQSFLQQRSSVFNAVSVSNFSPQFLEVQADIELMPGYQKDGVIKKINIGLNIFMSPWINSKQQQLKIDQGISDAQVATFISSIEGVAAVNQICFNTWIMIGSVKHKIISGYEGELMPADDNMLFVSAANHPVKVTIQKPVTV